MGWKGTVRSIGASVRAAERNAKKRQRELDKQHKQYEKMQELERAAYEVDVYENDIEIIQSLHKECNSPINWNEILLSGQPNKPEKTYKNRDLSSLKLMNYKPGLIDRLFKRAENKKKILSQDIANAAKDDEAIYKSIFSVWEKELEEWKENVEMAKALFAGNGEAKLEAIKSLKPFAEISNLGSSLAISIYDNGLIEAIINVHGKDIVPNESKSLIKSGKLSVKNMPKGKFNEIYQDYVCSAVLRVANELFSAIPDNMVVVTAVDELVSSKTGHLEESTILSVAVSRNTINSLNLATIDPSDSMCNFIHNMSFKKTKGFEAVKRIDTDALKPV